MQTVNMIRSILCTLAVITVIGSGPLYAEGDEKKPPVDRGAAKLKAKLGLDEKQTEAVTKIYQEARESRLQLQKKQANANPHSNYLDLPADSKEYELGYQKAAELAAESAKARVIQVAESRKKVYMLLNEEQKKKFLQLNKEKPIKMPKKKTANNKNDKKAETKQQKAPIE